MHMQVVVLPLKWGERADLDEWVSKAHAVIHAHVAKHQPTLMDIQATHGTVDLFLTVNMLPLLAFQLDKVPNVVSVARHLDFTPQLHNIATTLVRNLRREYNTAYVGCSGQPVFVYKHAPCNNPHTGCLMAPICAWKEMQQHGMTCFPMVGRLCGNITLRQRPWWALIRLFQCMWHQLYGKQATRRSSRCEEYPSTLCCYASLLHCVLAPTQEVEEWVYHHASALVHRRSLLR